MTENIANSARTLASPEQQKAKIEDVAKIIAGVIQGSKYQYFDEKPGDTDEKNGEKTMRVLAEARDRSAKRELLKDDERVYRVPVMGTLQTRNSRLGREYDSSVAIERLYDELSVLAGRGHRTYYDIRQDAANLAGSGATSPANVNDSTPTNLQGHTAIVDEKGSPNGVRLELGSDVYADFRLGNIDNPEAVEMGLVSINIVPTSEPYVQV